MIEIWKPIPGFIGYDASDLGRIRSWRKRGFNQDHRANEPRVLNIAGPKDHSPYCTFSLYRNAKHVMARVHICVLVTFRGTKKDGQQGRHINDNRADNRLENLIWGYPIQNQADRIRNGNGSRHVNGLLTDEEVILIRARLRTPYRGYLAHIAKTFGVHPGTIARIRDGLTYFDIEDVYEEPVIAHARR